MPKLTVKRALISVYDKTGIVDFARALVNEFGIEIISTGGTADLLKKNSVPVTLVEEVTGFPEMLDGRVKTLHPKIHAAILADRDNPEHMRQLTEQGIKPIDMVVVNLYPFEKTVADPNCTFEQAIEMIDIGGPCLLRAAAKNHKHVIPIVRHSSRTYVLEELTESGDLAETGRAVLASIAFEDVWGYDARVETFLTHRWTELRCGPLSKAERASDALPDRFTVRLEGVLKCPYGENPHQEAALYRALGTPKTMEISGLQTRAPSFNNYVDATAAFELCSELSRELLKCRDGLGFVATQVGFQLGPAAVFIKHTNACGVGLAPDPIEAYRKAYLGDPNAAMGGILAVNFPVDASLAEAVMDSLQRWGKQAGAGAFFLEVWIAPHFDDDAVQVIKNRKTWGPNVRLLDTETHPEPHPRETDIRQIAGGFLLQNRDAVGLNEDQWKTVTSRAPTEVEMNDLRLAWLVAKHTKSNAISICRDGMLIGNGAGQMSRVMSCRIATWLAKENGHTEKLAGAAAASDAFFPFADGPNILIDAGVTALIQPGGSKRDEDTIKACDDRNVAMIFTGTRHFKH